MEESKRLGRPGVLTTLAVINFIIAFVYIVAIGLTAVSLAFIDNIPLDSLGEAEAARIEAMGQLSAGEYAFMLGPTIIAAILLLLAGIGYLKQKKVLGWAMGNAYAVVMILSTVLSPIILPPALKGGTVSVIVSLAYPIITLILINLVYKKNLVN